VVHVDVLRLCGARQSDADDIARFVLSESDVPNNVRFLLVTCCARVVGQYGRFDDELVSDEQFECVVRLVKARRDVLHVWLCTFRGLNVTASRIKALLNVRDNLFVDATPARGWGLTPWSTASMPPICVASA